jgi:hypothetical protein
MPAGYVFEKYTLSYNEKTRLLSSLAVDKNNH